MAVFPGGSSMLIELLAVAALHQGSTPTPPPASIENPEWRLAPTPSWPRGGKEMDIVQADVVTSCTTAPEGRITDCRIESESPSGYGFAREVLASTSAARLDT